MCVRARESFCVCARSCVNDCDALFVRLFHFRPFTTYKNHILRKKIQGTCTHNMLPVQIMYVYLSTHVTYWLNDLQWEACQVALPSSWNKPVCRWGPTCQYNSWGEEAIMRHHLHLSPLPITSIYLLHSSPESIKSLLTVDNVLWELCTLTENNKDWTLPVNLDLAMVCSGYLVRQYLATKSSHR